MKTPLIHTPEREADLQRLAQAVISVSPYFFDNPNGGYEYTCPFCYTMRSGGSDLSGGDLEMKDIQHPIDCPYFIAKDLSAH